MHQKIAEFPILVSYFPLELERTGDTKFVDSYSDMIRMYLLTVYQSNSRIVMALGSTMVLGNNGWRFCDGVEGIVLWKGRDVGRRGESGKKVAG
jgi:hypothetical protein